MAQIRDAAVRLGEALADHKGLLATALTAGAAMGGLTYWAQRRTRAVEQANPPMGNAIEVAGTRLHYVQRGQGRPVVFLHGLGAMIQDWQLSVLDRAARSWRALAFDAPGYGWSERPRWTRWTPERQAATMQRAARRLGAERPLLVGHSFGALVALAWALDHPDEVAGLVLLSGYYYPTRRLDFPLLATPALPAVGTLARHTVTPAVGRAMLPRMIERMFAPNPVPAAYSLFPMDMLLRPGQIRAEAEDIGEIREAARRLSRRYGEIKIPTIILAGEEDRIVDPVTQALRLHQEIRHSVLGTLPDTGHMLHHIHPDEVMAAIDQAWHEVDIGANAVAAWQATVVPGAAPGDLSARA